MTLRWDALLTRELARELDERLSGMRLRAIRFDGSERDAVLHFREATLVWRLHPTRGGLGIHEPADPGPAGLPLPARVRRVRAPADERIIVIELLPTRRGRAATDIVVELLGNQWNCLVTEGEARTLRHVLHTRSGARVLRVGQPYEAPPPSERAGVDGGLDRARWDELVRGATPAERKRALISGIAWTSPINAEALLRSDEDGGGRALWQRLVSGEAEVRGALLDLPRGIQPYPYRLPGIDSEPVESLLGAFERLAVADSGEETTAAQLLSDDALARRLDDAIDGARRRATSLVAELDAVEDEAALRALGDLILARYAEVPSGAAEAQLVDFGGSTVTVQLEPGAPPQASAQAYYDRAAKAERARARLPELIRQAETRIKDLEALAEKARRGEATDDELERVLPEPRAHGPTGDDEPSLPYRRYRSSGGLEIRVGRGARHNDDLTFHHSAPDDVWLHARHAAGAHVILRWQGPGNPPQRDLADAAVLAALHSKARTSGSAPVDYTLRKYVRKPRRSAPGAVLPDRVKTIFVEPDPEALERLTWE